MEKQIDEIKYAYEDDNWHELYLLFEGLETTFRKHKDNAEKKIYK